jgi:hypothetical protein
MEDFILYCQLGWTHIMSLDALDHLLFISALTALYLISDWKKVLFLITAFTIGHSLTLFLSILDIVRFKDSMVEWMIPLTILTTSVTNLIQPNVHAVPQKSKYMLALLFGLIHGMGFANSIRMMMASSQHLLIPLLSFNIGIELAQMAVVLGVLILGTLLIEKAGLPQKKWIYPLSGLAAGMALMMFVQRFAF